MPISFNRVTTGYTMQQFANALEVALLAVGWTLEFADADAITGGTAADPGWGKAFAANASAGRAVFRMPAVGGLTRWYCEVSLKWGPGATSYPLNVRSALGVSGAGVLFNPGSGFGPDVDAVGGGEIIISASESGFAVGVNMNEVLGYVLAFERKRNLVGADLDDIVTHGSSQALVSNQNFLRYGSCVTRSATGGENSVKRLLYLWESAQPNVAWSTGNPATLAGAGANRGVPIGPMINSGGLGGNSGHYLFFTQADAPPGNEILVSLGGIDRTFQVSSFNSATGFYTAFLKA